MASAVPRSLTDTRSSLRMLELDQGAAKILRMQEQNRLAVRAHLGLAVAQHARALRLERIARGDDVVDLVAQMMDAAVRIALEEFRDRRGRAQRLQEFDLGVGQRDEHRGDAMRRLRLRRRHLGAERLAVYRRRLGDVADRDRHMVEPSDHASSLRPLGAAQHCASGPAFKQRPVPPSYKNSPTFATPPEAPNAQPRTHAARALCRRSGRAKLPPCAFIAPGTIEAALA